MILLHIQACQHGTQPQIALFKVGNRGHYLLISGVAACLVQLNCQVCQLLGMGSIMTYHILHKCHQLFHGGVLTTTAAAAVATFVAVVVGVTIVVEVVVLVGMRMAVFMGMAMLVGMGNTVMGVFMGVAMFVAVAVIAASYMIVMHMHRKLLRCFSL